MNRLRLICFVLVVLFGSSSWMGTNSVWMQLPLLTSSLPEGWSLPSYLAMVVQIACIGPLIYGVLHKCCCSLSSGSLIVAALLMAVVCQSGLAVFWSFTAGGYSVLLYAFMFGLALVNATSNVLFMPFMAQFHPSLLHAYFVGMGLSSLVPSMLSLSQGTSNFECVSVNGTMQPAFQPPRFSVSIYLWLIAGWTTLATAAFLVLQYRGWKDESAGETHEVDTSRDEEIPLKNGSRSTEMKTMSGEGEDIREQPSSHPSPYILLLLTAIVNAQMNGVIPSVHSFAALPYSQVVYHLGLTLSNIASPIASFIPMFCGVRSLPILSTLTGLSSLTTAFIVYLGLLSPSHLADSQSLGGVLSIVAVVVAAGLHSFLRTTFASSLRESGGGHSEHWLFWCGVFIQIGSFLGSALMFPLVNYTSLFQSAPMCRN
ncbi:hypothetical protein PFISCL1PPCAC_1580 [Pristionchus fissidentatus]|uniref:Riboflavin transporter n=1 Tax=Pristionchus fissidentatus TaxID=1538716 RepID=A0AAV5UVN9_9BILA|nr:hypothetical protein PFISCL1PPCAC_1580 [Pristionchus fissidentatus]